MGERIEPCLETGSRRIEKNTLLSRARWATALIMVASPLFAQSGTVLKGGVQQNVNVPSNPQVLSVVSDMYHQLSIMWGNPSASQEAQRTFQADISRFNGWLSDGSSLASRLVPCVQKYQQAYPHVVKQSQYYSQNNSSAFNSEAAVANPLIKAGASCVSGATADQFASNGGKTYNTYQGTPSSSAPAPVYQDQSGAWMPRCETPTSTNCYIWLLNPNGLYSHIYQGGPPNCSKGRAGGYDPSQNPACEPPAAPPPQQPGQPQPQPNPTRDEICDLRHLALYVMQRYGTARPIATYRLANSTSPTYVVFLSGMEPNALGQANTAGAALMSYMNVQALDLYRLAVIDALQDVPRGSNLILVGHSQGGIEAENVVQNLVERWGFRVLEVVTYGAPISVPKQPRTSYLYIRAKDDPLQGLDRVYDLSSDVLTTSPGTGNPLIAPNGGHFIYDKPQSGLDLIRVPRVSTLTTTCWELDLTSLQEFAAPNLFTRIFGAPQSAGPSSTPNNPDKGMFNCFWVSLAQDRAWATGKPFWAQPDQTSMASAAIPPVLQRWYGTPPKDDFQGPTAQAGLDRSRNGQPAQSSEAGIQKALQMAGPGGRGLVFVRDPNSNIGHAFNARNVNGTVHFWDAQIGADGSNEFQAGRQVFFYRTN
jgi:hypothetical protein